MYTIVCRTIIFLSLGVLKVHPLTLLQSKILVNEGGSYFQRVTDDDLNISKCQVRFTAADFENSIKSEFVVDLDLYSTNAVFPEGFEDTNDLKNRLHSVGSGFCGFKVDNVSLDDPDEWIIEVTTDETSTAKFTVGVYESIQLHSVKETSLGSYLTLNCGNTPSSSSYCFIYNPQDELVYRGDSCSYSISAVADEDIGKWRCILGATPYIEPLEFTVEVTVKDASLPEQWINETSDYVSFGCRIKDCCTKTPEYCIMTSPAGEKIRIIPGSASLRYTSLFANLKEYTCAIEIKKPLLEFEKGAWTCEINNRGMFLQVDKMTVTDKTFSSSTVTELGKSFQVHCKLPCATSYCFITSPIGERYKPQPLRTELGECSQAINKAQSEHNGTWICSFFRNDDVVAIQEKFEVFVRDAIKCSMEVSTLRGSESIMFCNTGRAPLEYCWFSSPTGKTYQLKGGIETPEVSYVGKGLNSGDCGIKVYKTEDEDVGNWTCSMKIGDSEEVYTMTLDLSTQIASAVSIGLGIGIGVSVILLGLIGVFLHRRHKRRSRIEEPETNTSNAEIGESSNLQQRRSSF